MLEIQGLTRRFGTKAAVDDVSLSIAPGAFVGVIGRSGAGKSTLLRMINRLVEPNAGRIVADGVDVVGLRGAKLRRWRRESAMIFQQFNLVGRLDVLTNVLIGRLDHMSRSRALLGLWRNEDRALALSALDWFDMAALSAQRCETLSGGQQQRVAIARALVQEPRIILADEPIASLDPESSRRVMELLATMNREYGCTVLVSLHQVDFAIRYCPRTIALNGGRIVYDGPSAALTPALLGELYGSAAHELFEHARPAQAQATSAPPPIAIPSPT